MLKKIFYASLFVLLLILAVQSVSASDADFNSVYSNDFNLDDSQSLSSVDLSYENGDIAGNGENEEIISNDVTVGDENDDSSPAYYEEVEEEENRNPTAISADPITFDYSSEGELNINLTDENGVGLSNRNVSVRINDDEANLTTDDDGLAVFRYSGAVGTYDVLVSFEGDELYAPSNLNTKITITKAKSKLIVPSVRAYLSYSTYVNITLVDSNGLALANKRISLVLSGISYNASTNSKGFAKIRIPTEIGNFTFSVRFEGDENYSASSLSSKAVITKMKTILTVPIVKSYVTRNTYLKISLRDVYNKALVNKPIFVTVGKKTYKLTTDENGTCKLKFDRKVGKFNCTVKFKATNSFCVALNRSQVIIAKSPVILDAPEIRFNSSQYGIFRIKLTDIDGRPLNKKVISVNLSSIKKVFKVKTNSNGVATLRINSAYTYHVVVKFAGSNSYAAKSVKSALHVNKVKVKFNDVVKVSELLNKYIFENRSLPSKIKYKNYTFTSAQVSYLMAVAINRIPSKNKDDIILIAALAPSKSSGEIYDTVYKENYLKIAKKAVGSTLNHKDPSYIKYSFYKVPYKVYTASFAGILKFYGENKKLPNYSLFTNAEYVKVSNSSKYTFYLTTDNIAGKRADLKMLKSLKKALNSKGYQALIVGIGPDIHNKAYRYGCTGKNSVLLCCFGGVDVGCIEEWAGDLSVGDGNFVRNYKGAHVLGLWYSKPYGASASLKKPVGRAWDANYGFALKNPAKYMSDHKISYIETGTVTSACTLLKAGKMGGPKLIR